MNTEDLRFGDFLFSYFSCMLVVWGLHFLNGYVNGLWTDTNALFAISTFAYSIIKSFKNKEFIC